MMRFHSLLVMGLCVVLLSGGVVFAEADTPAERETAAKAYLKVQPVSQLYTDAVHEMAQNVPDNKREFFIQKMTDAIDMQKLEKLAVESLVKNFTAGELSYMAEFYGSEKGRAIYQKLPNYLTDIAVGMKSVIRPVNLEQSGAASTTDSTFPSGQEASPADETLYPEPH